MRNGSKSGFCIGQQMCTCCGFFFICQHVCVHKISHNQTRPVFDCRTPSDADGTAPRESIAGRPRLARQR